MNFEVKESEVVAILGPSGSGKSTLLSLLALLDSPDSGNLSFDGNDATNWDENRRTLYRGENIGIIFQQFHLVPYLTALENVTLPLVINSSLKESEIHQRAEELLQSVRLGDRMSHKPSQLSGGECQRVAFARSLIHRPKILLADEPSGNLDQGTSSTVMDLFFDLVRKTKTTTLLVTHDPQLAEFCDRKLTLSRGQLCSSN
ncbi:ABC transporter ATP-binding protein [bacterium]|nr:ABC transporter ATP-binding protein [bacterium]